VSKLRCDCGHIIVDQTDNLPYKGMLIRDQDMEPYFDGITTSINAFIEAIKANKREEWIASFFGKDYPAQLDNVSILWDIRLRYSKYETTVFQCEACGRVLLEIPYNKYYSFKPYDKPWVKVLQGISKQENKTEE
jgi:hypothetical protein